MANRHTYTGMVVISSSTAELKKWRCNVLAFNSYLYHNNCTCHVMQVKLMTHTMQCIFAVISPQFCIRYRLTHWTWIHSENCKCKWKPSVYMWGNSSHVLFVPKTLSISVEKTFSCQKPFAYTVQKAFEFTSLQQQWEKH